MTADLVGLAREGRITPTIRPTRWVTQVAHEPKSVERQRPFGRDAPGGHWRRRGSERATRREEDLGRLSGDAVRRVTAEARSRRMVQPVDWNSLGRATADQHGHSLAARCQRAAIARSTLRAVNGGDESRSDPPSSFARARLRRQATFAGSRNMTCSVQWSSVRPGLLPRFRALSCAGPGPIGTRQVPIDARGPSRGHLWLAAPPLGTCDVPAADEITSGSARAEACAPGRLRERVRPGGETRSRRPGRCG